MFLVRISLAQLNRFLIIVCIVLSSEPIFSKAFKAAIETFCTLSFIASKSTGIEDDFPTCSKASVANFRVL